MINIKRLKYFSAVVKAGSVSRAAQELGLAQPAPSIQICDLETELGLALVERHSRGVRKTEAGRLLYRYIGELDRLADHCWPRCGPSATAPAAPSASG